jgi:hypothetical protein
LAKAKDAGESKVDRPFSRDKSVCFFGDLRCQLTVFEYLDAMGSPHRAAAQHFFDSITSLAAGQF